MNAKTAGLLAGLLALLLFLVLPAPPGLSTAGMRAAAVTLLMTIWWITEAIPIYATAFVPLALFPLLGVLDAGATAENYGHNYVLMLLGGFFIAKAIERHGLHRRIALVIIERLGTGRRQIMLAFMLATAFLSMWIANVAVTLLMLPIALAIITQEEQEAGTQPFGLALMLAIAYAASIGGTGTLIGTPPNMVLAGMLTTLFPEAPEISFFEWMKVGLPLVAVFLPLIWWYLTRYFGISGSFSGSRQIIESELRALGPIRPAEKRVLAVFVLVALGWVFRRDFQLDNWTVPGWGSLLGVNGLVHDATVAIAGALALFALPAGKGQGRLLDWKDAETVPWGVVMIVGGGYAIAAGFATTGLAEWIGQRLSFISGFPLPLLLLLVVTLMIFLTEINSNTATANIFLPVLATMAVAGGANPLLLMVPATFACSFAFMLPSGTGTNTVIFASGRVTIPEMARCGFWLNLISVVLLTILLYLVVIPFLGITEGVPAWAG